MGKPKMRSSAPSRSRQRHIYINDRDIEALTWIGEQLAVNSVHLQYLLGRMSPHPERLQTPGVLSIHTVRQVVERWESDGLVSVRKFRQGQPHWIWLTTNGLRHMNMRYPYSAPRLVLLNHHHAVNTVRLSLERKHGDKLRWRSERDLVFEQREQIASGNEPAPRHLPDAEVIFEGKVQAVEVELTRKSRKRLIAIMVGLRARYRKGVAYIVDDSCRALVEDAIDAIWSKDEAKAIWVSSLSDYQL